MLLTWLYVPGDRPDRFGKAVDSGADAVILDLEDAVVAARKAYAREAVAEFVATPHRVPVFVRVNELTGPDVGADLDAVAGAPGLAGLRLPKVESPEAVRAVAERTSAPLDLLVESALGVERAYEIATAHPAVASLGLGEADLRSDLGVTAEEGLTWVRGRIVVAARAAGLPPPAMPVYANVTDLAGLAESCARGRQLGFVGRTAIHPRQLPVIVEAFRPSEAEVLRARELLAAVAEAETRDTGTVVLPDGRFADRAMVAAARRTVDLAERY
ncbi:CoA ester lyase [Micromonospora sp. HM5-17]|jgi:citrate lyase subunit beta/citryl-CoA lyase|uniref:HpcH/HpaI aldolase/citrate lyase family protein n=1 Tax=Micromonospora sp. HM5-17 TaxID=2487710 RepID=UPI000F4692D5|nr:CoA ester lyase [Micromonospora sp. HM5-17]ROT32485.1 CoA ester lyase [Micromonospora sp. HM5-17]